MDDVDGCLAAVQSLESLIKEIVAFCMSHNAEAEACDLLIEVERMEYLDHVIDENSYSRVCLYLTRYFIGQKSNGVISQILKDP